MLYLPLWWENYLFGSHCLNRNISFGPPYLLVFFRLSYEENSFGPNCFGSKKISWKIHLGLNCFGRKFHFGLLIYWYPIGWLMDPRNIAHC